ncbi:hypothetical protein C8R44DRAFT_727347 [Mycena epipterygia]|nr:hypothetical protein C8R44DRAFT_727347 [Mycena epipterygia]
MFISSRKVPFIIMLLTFPRIPQLFLVRVLSTDAVDQVPHSRASFRSNTHSTQTDVTQNHSTLPPTSTPQVQGWGPLQPDVPEYPNQLWKVQYTDNPGVGSYRISNVQSGTYLEIQGGNATDGTPVTCSAAAGGETTTDQEWELIKIGTNYNNSMYIAYLDIDKGSSENGTKIQGWWGELDGSENQLWAFSPARLPSA